ncbi:hypothetical protein A2U01_0093198, partial [Trifolium medium]|nr:hypothetical protein [Trifolium medium]
CEKLQVPTRGRDEIKNPVETLRRTFFIRAQSDLEAVVRVVQAAATQPPPSPPHQQQHQVPPHIPQQHQYSDYELGKTATL